jgi:hypothetical protein
MSDRKQTDVLILSLLLLHGALAGDQKNTQEGEVLTSELMALITLILIIVICCRKALASCAELCAEFSCAILAFLCCILGPPDEGPAADGLGAGSHHQLRQMPFWGEMYVPDEIYQAHLPGSADPGAADPNAADPNAADRGGAVDGTINNGAVIISTRP